MKTRRILIATAIVALCTIASTAKAIDLSSYTQVAHSSQDLASKVAVFVDAEEKLRDIVHAKFPRDQYESFFMEFQNAIIGNQVVPELNRPQVADVAEEIAMQIHYRVRAVIEKGTVRALHNGQSNEGAIKGLYKYNAVVRVDTGDIEVSGQKKVFTVYSDDKTKRIEGYVVPRQNFIQSAAKEMKKIENSYRGMNEKETKEVNDAFKESNSILNQSTADRELEERQYLLRRRDMLDEQKDKQAEMQLEYDRKRREIDLENTNKRSQ